MSKELTKEEHNDMTMTPILSKYQYQKPKDFGDYTERCYPVSAVMDMLKEYSDQNTKPLIDEIEKLKASKSEANEAVESNFIEFNKNLEIHNRQLQDKIYELEQNNIEFVKWIFNECDLRNGHFPHQELGFWHKESQKYFTLIELYEIFKTRNNK